jgi:hypothetical protein
MIELLAFDSRDRIVHGMIELNGDRLADVLTRPERSLQAESAMTRGLRDGRLGVVLGKHVNLEELSVVVATGPRGAQNRRIETLRAPFSVHVGPYVVFGYLHAPAPNRPSLDNDTRPWFAITEAIIEYSSLGRAIRERRDTVLVNRAHESDALPMDVRLHEARWLASQEPVDWDDRLAVALAR